jgi:HD superfamily phosphohydrolase YqeK
MRPAPAFSGQKPVNTRHHGNDALRFEHSLQVAHIAMMLAARQSMTVERPRSSSI